MRSIQGMRPLLGVKQGGTQGRLGTFHMGLTGTWGGGLNSSGSGRKPIANSHGPAGAKPGGPLRPSKPGAFGNPFGAGRPLANSHGPASSKPRPGSSAPSPLAPAPTAPTVSVAPLVPPTDPLDYRSQSGYIRDMAMLNDGLALDRRGLQSQLEEGQRLYGMEMGDARRAAQDSVVRDSASLAARGLSSSGMREDTDADRIREFDRHMADIEQQHGTGLTARINAALAELERQDAFAREGIEGDYRDEWGQLHPAAPIGQPDPVVAGVDASKPGVPARNPLAPRPASHPNAKTFTDGQGNVRAIGGRLVRPAPVGRVPVGTPAPVPVGGPVKGSLIPSRAPGVRPSPARPNRFAR